QSQHAALHIFAIDFQPADYRLVAGELASAFDHGKLLGLVADLDLVSGAHLEGRDVHATAIDVDVAVADNLPRLASRCGKSQAVDHVVQTALQLLQEQLAGYTGFARGFFEIITELVFQGEVHALGLLLFTELKPVAHDFGFAILAMLAGSKIAFFHRALIGKTFRALEEQLHAFATAKAADCTFISSQFPFSFTSGDDRFTGGDPFVPIQFKDL